MRLNRILLLAAAVLMLALPASAQTVMTNTTLAANLSDTATTMVVSSASSFTVGRYVWIDNEVLQITSITGTTIGIQRGQLGTAAQAHDNTEVVLTGVNNHFQQRDPSFGADCTRGSGDASYSPFINVLSGIAWNCQGSVWQGSTSKRITYNSTTLGNP